MGQGVPRAGPHTPATEVAKGGAGDGTCGARVGAAARRVAPCLVPRSYCPASWSPLCRGASVCVA